jgi:hypothetical protein
MNLNKLIKEELDSILDENLYHGSPHDFEEFLTDYMGSGEGNQSFGWGLYFTELEDIADRYSRIKNNIISIAQHLYGLGYTVKDVERLEAMKNEDIIKLLNNKFDIEYLKLKERFKDKPNKIDYYHHLLDVKISLRDRYIDYIKSTNPTKYYIVFKNKKSVNDFTWLEWDKPLKSQPLKTIHALEKEFSLESFNEDFRTAGDFYKYKAIMLDSSKKVSELLLSLGIDGIKYPAESIARGKTSETARGFNYVIFDPSIIKIEKKIKY